MNDQVIIGSMLHSKMEQLLIPYKTVKMISDKVTLPKQVVKDKENEYIKKNMKKWNMFSKEEKSYMRETWYEEAAVLDYLREKGVIDKTPPGDVEMLWQEDQDGNIISCDIRLYYNSTGQLGGTRQNVQK